MFCYKDQWDPECTTTRHNMKRIDLHLLVKHANSTENDSAQGRICSVMMNNFMMINSSYYPILLKSIGLRNIT